MRITNNITQGRYLDGNNRSQTSMLKSYTRIITQRRFNRVSEDPINGSKALIVRRQLRDLTNYKSNLNTAKELFNAAETNLNKVAHDLYIKIEEDLVSAGNGTHDDQELKIYATSLEQTAEAMVDTINGDFSERQIFGGTNSSVTPFRYGSVIARNSAGDVVYPPYFDKYYTDNGDGTVSLKENVKFDDVPKSVTYNDVPVDFNAVGDMVFTDGTIGRIKADTYSVYVFNDVKDIAKKSPTEVEISQESIDEAVAGKDNSKIFPGSKSIYIDIGIGVKYDKNYEMDPQTALDISLNGAAITGSGVTLTDDWLKNNTEVVNGVRQIKETETYVGEKQAMKHFGVSTVEELEAKMAEKGWEIKTVTGPIEADNKVDVVDGEVKRYQIKYKDFSGIYSNNLMQITFDSSSALKDGGYNSTMTNFDYDDKQNTKNGDQAYVNGAIDKANLANRKILTAITDLGSKQNSIEFYETKIESYEFNLSERQNLVEGTDLKEEISNYYNIRSAYEAWLKIGTQIIPNSIFDFI